MTENWSTDTRYPPEAPSRNHFPSAINLNFSAATYGPILEPNQAYNMLENMANYSCQTPSEHAEIFEQGGRTHFGAAAFYNGNMSSMDEKRFINNNSGYTGYRGNFYSNQYHHNLHNRENFLYASYSDEGKPSLENLVDEFVRESSKGLETSLDVGRPSLEDIFVEFATTLSKRMKFNEQKLDDLELYMVDLGARLNNLANQMCQITKAVNVRTREIFFDDDDETIESTPTYEEPFPSEHDEGRIGKEEMYDFHNDIYNLSYPQHHTQLFEFQLKQDLESVKILPTNNCVVEFEFVAQEEDLKRKRIEKSDEWSFKEKEPPGMENWASVARGQHEDLSTMGWSIDNIIGETPIVEVDFGQQCLRRVKPKYTRYFDPP